MAGLCQANQANADTCGALRILEAFAEVLAVAVLLNQRAQLLASSVAVVLPDRVQVAQRHDLAARWRDLPCVEDVMLVRRKGRVHHDQVGMADLLRLDLHPVVADQPAVALQAGQHGPEP